MKGFRLENGRKNVIGKRVRSLRMSAKLSQRQLAVKLQLLGYEFDRLTVLRVERGIRFVADYEVMAFARALGVEMVEIYDGE